MILFLVFVSTLLKVIPLGGRFGFASRKLERRDSCGGSLEDENLQRAVGLCLFAEHVGQGYQCTVSDKHDFRADQG